MSDVVLSLRRVEAARSRAGWLRASVTLFAVLALTSLALEYGFYRPPLPEALLVGVQVLAVALYIVARVHALFTLTDRGPQIRATWIDLGILAVVLIIVQVRAGLNGHPALGVSAFYVGILQALLIGRLAMAAIRLNFAISQARLHPTRVLALTFFGLIVVGTLVLALPRATSPALHQAAGFSIPLHLLNCAFTATSAVCVTGLVVYDTGTDFTMFGQFVILALIQAGGLGIMIFGGAMGLLVGQRLSLKHSLVLQDALSHRTMGQLRSMVLFIIVFTFVAEVIGAVLMYPMWQDVPTVGARWFHSVFHAISAFCNAGFALRADSLMSYSGDWQVYGCIMPLITLGGLGFPVLYDLTQSTIYTVRRWWTRSRGVPLSTIPWTHHRMSIHTRLVLITSGVLIFFPTIGFVLIELFGAGTVQLGGPETLAGAKGAGIWLDALFYSVTCRTAGFNTVAMDGASLSPASHLLGAILMFIGGSPASCAGGIKTVSLAVLMMEVWATLRGRPATEVFHRTIPDDVGRRAAVITVLMLALVSSVTLLLCFTEGAPLLVSLFETVSAAGTVGLTMGLTVELTPIGRVLIILTMFLGRLGPMTMLVALTGRARPVRFSYPTEAVSIG